MSQAASASSFSGRVLVVEDDPFLRLLLVDALKSRGISGHGAADTTSAFELVQQHDPHVVIADLDLGAGPSGADLLAALHRDRPWLGLIVLTGHADPVLALPVNTRVPERCIYLVKNALGDLDILLRALSDSLSGESHRHVTPSGDVNDQDSSISITQAQGEVLRLVALGMSNNAVAAERRTTRRAAEMQIQRLFAALGVANADGLNARVLAARMWRDGRVSIR